MGICQYCGEQKKLCKAHIIPKSLLKFQENSEMVLYSADGFPKRRLEGSYDKSIFMF